MSKGRQQTKQMRGVIKAMKYLKSMGVRVDSRTVISRMHKHKRTLCQAKDAWHGDN